MPSKVGKYQIVSALSSGSVGDSSLAEDSKDGRPVVLTLLRAGVDRKVQEETRRIAALSHPSIASAQVGLEGDRVYLATDAVEGVTLDGWLKKSRKPAELISAALQVAEVVQYIHSQDVLHRDLREANVRVLPNGTCALVGFAVGRQSSPHEPGPVACTAPEVLQGQPETTRSEVFSAGLLIYEIFAGQNPFMKTSAEGTRTAVLTVQPTPLSELRKELARDVADAVMGCLEKDPEWRPKDLSYIIELLQAQATGGKAGKASKAKAAPGAAR
jgi:serine/threonine-protein kinase